MRLMTACLLTFISLLLIGCSKSREAGDNDIASTAPAQQPQAANRQDAQFDNRSTFKIEKASLNDAADKAQASNTAMERKIIRNAELHMEVSNPSESQRRIASIAESRGGFVVNSDASQRQDNDKSRPEMTVTVVVRVPAAQFDATLNEIRGAASRIMQEKTTGQDVTEEYIDLEARIRTKQALEAQFLEIMKQAKSVTDALEVQRQLAEVRTEIEQLEGHRRYLENQSSLSTITVTLQSPTPIVSTSGFFYSVRQAFADGVDIAATITLFLIRALITLLPVAIFIFLPLALIARYFIRRARRMQLADALTREEALSAAKTD
ncbi:MAG TPA: DUF4349 domain-containing protein [Pyrinomonadaceae bacterium]